MKFPILLCAPPHPIPLPRIGEGVKKLILFFFIPANPGSGPGQALESSVFKALPTCWTPVFTGVTGEIQLFHTLGGEGRVRGEFQISLARSLAAFFKEIKCTL
jgi:hypothetical protein